MAKTFHILAQDPTKIGQIRIVITSPTGRVVEAAIEETETGFRVRFSPSEVGDYTIEIFLDDNPASETPFHLISVDAEHGGGRRRSEDISPGSAADEETRPPPTADDKRRDSEYVSCEPTGTDLAPERVRAFGDGLIRGVVDEPALFFIDTRGAGRANIDLTVEGPSEVNFQCHDNGDGTCTVAYSPTLAGLYFVNVCFAEKHIPGSPFRVVVDEYRSPSASADFFRRPSASSSNDVIFVRNSSGSPPSGKMVCAFFIINFFQFFTFEFILLFVSFFSEFFWTFYFFYLFLNSL